MQHWNRAPKKYTSHVFITYILYSFTVSLRTYRGPCQFFSRCDLHRAPTARLGDRLVCLPSGVSQTLTFRGGHFCVLMFLLLMMLMMVISIIITTIVPRPWPDDGDEEEDDDDGGDDDDDDGDDDDEEEDLADGHDEVAACHGLIWWWCAVGDAFLIMGILAARSGRMLMILLLPRLMMLERLHLLHYSPLCTQVIIVIFVVVVVIVVIAVSLLSSLSWLSSSSSFSWSFGFCRWPACFFSRKSWTAFSCANASYTSRKCSLATSQINSWHENLEAFAQLAAL